MLARGAIASPTRPTNNLFQSFTQSPRQSPRPSLTTFCSQPSSLHPTRTLKPTHCQPDSHPIHRLLTLPIPPSYPHCLSKAPPASSHRLPPSPCRSATKPLSAQSSWRRGWRSSSTPFVHEALPAKAFCQRWHQVGRWVRCRVDGDGGDPGTSTPAPQSSCTMLGAEHIGRRR